MDKKVFDAIKILEKYNEKHNEKDIRKLVNWLSEPSLTTFCFISYDDYIKNLDRKIKQFESYVQGVTFLPKYAFTHFITEPEKELGLMINYLEANLSKDDYDRIKKGFNIIILIDIENSSECQVLLNKCDLDKFDEYVDNNQIKVFRFD